MSKNQSDSDRNDGQPMNFESLDQIKDFLTKNMHGRIKLKIYMLFTELSDSKDIVELFKISFDIKQINDLWKVSLKVKEEQIDCIGYLWFYPNPAIPIFFSTLSQETLDVVFLGSFLMKSHLINTFWITHSLINELLEYLETSFESRIYQYNGIYLPSSKKKSEIRPDISRKINYKGSDCNESIKELNRLYGICVEKFTTLLKDRQDFTFNRKIALFSIRSGDLNTYLEIIGFIFDKAERYIKEIKNFKRTIVQSRYLKRDYSLSNSLLLEFDQQLDDEVLSEMKDMISKEFEIVFSNLDDSGKFPVYTIKAINKEKKGCYEIVLTPHYVEVFQSMKTNLMGVIPLLDIIEYCQPNLKIQIITP